MTDKRFPLCEPPTNITIIVNGKSPEDAQKYMTALLAKIDQERREYEIYEKGRRDGQSGLLGIFGF